MNENLEQSIAVSLASRSSETPILKMALQHSQEQTTRQLNRIKNLEWQDPEKVLDTVKQALDSLGDTYNLLTQIKIELEQKVKPKTRLVKESLFSVKPVDRVTSLKEVLEVWFASKKLTEVRVVLSFGA